MGYREQWKMIHLINNSKTGQLDTAELASMGVYCMSDTIFDLVNKRIVDCDDPQHGPYRLNAAANAMINEFIVCNGNRDKTYMQVDQPSCFIIMPFSEPWSDAVYNNLIEPAFTEINFECIRGDEIERTGQLNANIFKELQKTGFVIAEISSPNPNVYYEIGVVDTLGKDILFLFDPSKNKKIPADKEGVHYFEYSHDDLPEAKGRLVTELLKIADKYYLRNTPAFCNWK